MKKIIFRTVFVLVLAVMLFAGYKVTDQVVTEKKEGDAFENLRQDLERDPESATEESVTGSDTEADVETETEAVTGKKKKVLKEYTSIYKKNKDLFGWIQIEGTLIDYPVMYTPKDAQYYLHRNFDRDESQSGTPFMDALCEPDCGNYIIYGHNMKNGSMFGKLSDYKDKSYWEEHPIVQFDTIYEHGTYEVFAAFYSKIYNEKEDGFEYYTYRTLNDEKTFKEYVTQVQKNALYDTGIEVEYGTSLITLSTCDYHTTDGRFVVVARRVEE